MAFIDYYKILGVDRNIPQKDVRRAFLKRAKQFHPDLHPDDPKAKAKFQALNEAYEVIGDPEKRKKYDQYGQNWKEADAFNQAGGNAGGGTEFHWARRVAVRRLMVSTSQALALVVAASQVSLRICLAMALVMASLRVLPARVRVR